MNIERKAVIIIISFIPIIVSAHGEEVIYTLFLQAILILIFIVITIALKTNLKKKLILAGIFALSIIASWIITNNIPYQQNELKINLILFLVPIISFIIAFLFLKFKLKKQNRVE